MTKVETQAMCILCGIVVVGAIKNGEIPNSRLATGQSQKIVKLKIKYSILQAITIADGDAVQCSQLLRRIRQRSSDPHRIQGPRVLVSHIQGNLGNKFGQYSCSCYARSVSIATCYLYKYSYRIKGSGGHG